jgi:cellulose synthase/poly-beta-1,6-N-acetylglucosamine synthase-like glycosyltransferase
VKDIEIPYEKDRGHRYRFFEILPGALSYTLFLVPLILSFVNVTAVVFFVVAYILIYFTRGMAVNFRALAGFRVMRQHMKIDWNQLITEVETGVSTITTHPAWHYNNLQRLKQQGTIIKPNQVVHALIIATYNESREVLVPTIKTILDSEYDLKNVILVLAYEERGGVLVQEQSEQLMKEFGGNFKAAMAVKHPKNIPGEVIGKGGNITFAARELQKYLEKEQINPDHVIVTSLDSDNRPHKKYLAALTYLYCVAPDPVKASYQPLAMYTNNIWDAPAPMRVIATGNNFFYIVLTQRPHLERNFSAHAQSMRALIDMDFWSVRTIVEDGHQFWRSYFYYDGDYRVYPLSIPIYQDAVLAHGYIKTLKAQFIQLRRWTYGASDIAYIANQGFMKKNKAPRRDVLAKFLRTLEGHVTWATGAPLITFAAFIPALVSPKSFAANELPLLISRIQTIGLVGALASLYVALKTLPPRPARYKRHRSIFMLLQWVYLPVTTLVYGSFAAIYSQTRLIFKRYPSKFDLTEKAVIAEEQPDTVLPKA